MWIHKPISRSSTDAREHSLRMISIYDRYIQFFPENSRDALKSLLRSIETVLLPSEAHLATKVLRRENTIVVLEKGGMIECLPLIALGFQHFLHSSREDFSQELLATAIMISKPKSFANDPFAFFFNGLRASPDPAHQNMRCTFSKNSEKLAQLQKLDEFLKTHPKGARLSEVIVQVADEMISNALFSAPRDRQNLAMYQHLPRTSDVSMAEGKEVTFFSSMNDERIIVGCEDLYGSMDRDHIIKNLKRIFDGELTKPHMGSAGAGFGLRYMIENSASFYMYCERNTRSVVACGFLLKGMRSNLTIDRHLHIGIPQAPQF